MLDPLSVAELVEHFTEPPGASPLRAQQYEPLGDPSIPVGDGIGDPRSSAKIRRIMFDPAVQGRLDKWRRVAADLAALSDVDRAVLAARYTPRRWHEEHPELDDALGPLVRLVHLTAAGAPFTLAELARKAAHPSTRAVVAKVRDQAGRMLEVAVAAYSVRRVERERAAKARREALLAEEEAALRVKLWGKP